MSDPTSFEAMVRPNGPSSKTEPDDIKDQSTRGRSTRSRVEPARRWTIALRYVQQEKLQYIADGEGISDMTVLRIVKSFGIPLRGRGVCPPTDAQMLALDQAMLIQLRKRGQLAGTPGNTARWQRARHHYRNAALWLSMAIKTQD